MLILLSGSLHCVDVSIVLDVLKVHTASIFRVEVNRVSAHATHFDPEDGSSVYFQNVATVPTFTWYKDTKAESASIVSYFKCLTPVFQCYLYI
jgi:hypothetical protein